MSLAKEVGHSSTAPDSTKVPECAAILDDKLGDRSNGTEELFGLDEFVIYLQCLGSCQGLEFTNP